MTQTAITTKYLGPTNTKGSRIKATADGHSVTLPLDHATPTDERRHRPAAVALCRKLGWEGYLIAGHTRTGYVYVFVPLDLEHVIRKRHSPEVIRPWSEAELQERRNAWRVRNHRAHVQIEHGVMRTTASV